MVENLEIHDSNLKKGIHHSCSQILDKTMVGAQLANEMQKIVQNLPEDTNIRQRELITQASEAVVSFLKKQTTTKIVLRSKRGAEIFTTK